MRTPRWSELSFQCSGEVTYQNESIWLEGPKNITKPVDDRMPDEQQTVLPARMVESWLSDTSSSFEHEEEIPVRSLPTCEVSKADKIGLRYGIIALQGSCY